MGWIKATKDEAQSARTNGQPVKFTSEGWMVQGNSDLVPQAEAEFKDMLPQAKATFSDLSPLRRTEDGKYATAYVECPCGQAYLVKSEHEKFSAQHKKWAKGYSEVPTTTPQPMEEGLSIYPVGVPTPPLELGVNKLCSKCKAKNKKGLDYYPDPDSRQTNRYPCRSCNGHGVKPNV